MTKLSWTNLCHIVIVYYMTIFIIVINGKSILFGKSIIELNGNIKIPVFVPISWLIHDIHSAKLIGQKSDANDMMTSDMTPDLNGNFERQPSDEKHETSGSDPRITNRVSDTQPITEAPKVQDLTPREEYSKERHQQMKNSFMDSEEMRLRLESNEQKFMAKQRFRDEIMYEPDVWPKEVDPLLTTIEIYEVPGAGNYLGLASNRTAVHKAPEEQTDKKDDKLKIRLNVNKIKTPRVKEPKLKRQKFTDLKVNESKVKDPKLTELNVKPTVKVSKYSNNNNNNNYFKNYLKANKNKFNK